LIQSSESGEISEIQEGSRDKQTNEIPQIISAHYSTRSGQVELDDPSDRKVLESKGFGSRTIGSEDTKQFFLYDYEVLYLLYTSRLTLQKGKRKQSFDSFAAFASGRDENGWTRFLIYRDLRTRGYIVREGFGFPIDFRVYDRGDYGLKAAKYIVFGLVEGKNMPIRDLKRVIDDMTRMGKEAVVAVVERRGEVIYYKVGKWYPIKPL
jgi:tRNA-intron endonuclease, archaea type